MRGRSLIALLVAGMGLLFAREGRYRAALADALGGFTWRLPFIALLVVLGVYVATGAYRGSRCVAGRAAPANAKPARSREQATSEDSVTDEEAELRALLAEPWAPGHAGKALLLGDGTLLTWRTVVGGAPHHTGAQQLLGIATETLAAYLAIEPDGEVELWPRAEVVNADQLVDEALARDERLYRTLGADNWAFGDD